MLGELERADRSIYLEMYIMIDDVQGKVFMRILEQKAEEGLSVKLVLDSFGSLDLSTATVERLRNKGVEVLFFSRWLHRLHRKLLIIDERVVITGGVNIHRSAETWADLAIRIKGDKVVRTALRFFTRTYFTSGGTDVRMRRFLKQNSTGISGSSFLSSGPRYKFKHLYRDKIAGAVHSVCLVTPYFAPGRWLMGVLDTAALRGVSVTILVPATCDSWFMDRVNRFYMTKMQKTNVQFFLYPEMNHAKVLVLDQTEVFVGSTNIDSLSFNYNLESGVLIKDAIEIRKVDDIVDGWMSESEPFEGDTFRPRWYDRLLSPVIRLFQPFL